MPAVVASYLPSVYWLVGIWIFGGLIALIGALCFSELTTTYPDRGGDYGYLKRAYHHRVGFAFSWAAFWVIRPGNIGGMAMIFAEFASQVVPWDVPRVLYATGSVAVISLLNLIGIRFGKTTQNILTVAKVLGILLIVLAAFVLWPRQSTELDSNSAADNTPVVATAAEDSGATNAEEEGEPTFLSYWNAFWIAMVFVMFTFGGWNDLAFVATEVKEPQKNLLRALILGTISVLVVYLVFIFALVQGVGFEQMSAMGAKWENPTSVLVDQRMGGLGRSFFACLVCISCLGAINAMVFTSPRIYWATAVDYPKLRWLAGTQSGNGWWRAMFLQMLVTILLIVTFSREKGGVENIVAATAIYFWVFLSFTVIGLIVCRIRYRGQFSGYRVPLYPLTPVVFVAVCLFMGYRSWVYMVDKDLAIPTMLIGVWVAIGAVLSFFMGHEGSKEAK